jgi:hypothetical protein
MPIFLQVGERALDRTHSKNVAKHGLNLPTITEITVTTSITTVLINLALHLAPATITISTSTTVAAIASPVDEATITIASSTASALTISTCYADRNDY